MGVTLITWSCGHFVEQKSPAYRTEAQFLDAVTEDYWFPCETAEKDLANKATENHIASSDSCPKCQEQPTKVAVWHYRAVEDIEVLRNLHEGCKACYLEIGANYHHLDSSQKARYAYDKRCATTHAQLWVSTVPRSTDPFFIPISNISRLYNQAQDMLNTSSNETHEDIKAAYVPINKARAELGQIITSLNELLFAVHLMEGAPANGKSEVRWHSGFPSREAMICIPKAIAWMERMEDWQGEALDTLRKVLSKAIEGC
jgi:hypothetical protein